MKRKRLVAAGILSVCLLTCGCGNNTTITGQDTEDTVIVQEAERQETETGEAETQEVETQGTEIQETTGIVEETDNYENYEELVSVPVDGRDGSQEKPYQVGDEIYFPKVYVGDENGNAEYSLFGVNHLLSFNSLLHFIIYRSAEPLSILLFPHLQQSASRHHPDIQYPVGVAEANRNTVFVHVHNNALPELFMHDEQSGSQLRRQLPVFLLGSTAAAC